MKQFIQIHRNDPASVIPDEALKSVLFKLSSDLFDSGLATLIQAAPAPFHREAVSELIVMYFDQRPDNHVLLEVESDPQQRPLSVTTSDTMRSLFAPKPHTRVVAVPSSTRNINHFVTMENDEPKSCTCEAFTYRETCKHLEQAKQRV